MLNTGASDDYMLARFSDRALAAAVARRQAEVIVFTRALLPVLAGQIHEEMHLGTGLAADKESTAIVARNVKRRLGGWIHSCESRIIATRRPMLDAACALPRQMSRERS